MWFWTEILDRSLTHVHIVKASPKASLDQTALQGTGDVLT